MIKQKGFTLIEGMIVVVIVATVGMLVLQTAMGVTSINNTVSYGINGMTEMRCIDGYKFVIGAQGQTRQVMDEFGKGVKCQ